MYIFQKASFGGRPIAVDAYKGVEKWLTKSLAKASITSDHKQALLALCEQIRKCSTALKSSEVKRILNCNGIVALEPLSADDIRDPINLHPKVLSVWEMVHLLKNVIHVEAFAQLKSLIDADVEIENYKDINVFYYPTTMKIILHLPTVSANGDLCRSSYPFSRMVKVA